MRTSVKIDGLEQLRKRLTELDPKLEKKAARAALREAGKVFQAEIRKNVAGLELSDSAKETLRRSVALRVGGRRGRLGVRVLIRKPDRREDVPGDKEAQARARQGAFFWRWIEFGTAKRTRQVAWEFDLQEVERGKVWDPRAGRYRRATSYSRIVRRTTRGAYTGFIKPQPFVRPAIEAATDAAAEKLEETLRAHVGEAFRGRG